MSDQVIDKPNIVHGTNLQNEQVPIHLPGGCTIMIMNDNYTPFEVVIIAICEGTNLSFEEATKRMVQAHAVGWSPIASYSTRDLAETVASKIENSARANTDYDQYRKRLNFNDPWPLSCEVMDAKQ